MKLLAVLATAALLAACGAASPGRGGYEVTVMLADALDVAPGAAVTVDGAPAGAVESVRLAGFTAAVRLRLDDGVRLPGNAVAEVRHASLLGEDDHTIALAPPADAPAAGRLTDGDVIPLARSGGGLPVEELLSAMSVLLAGGGLEQLRTISTELSAALTGREQSVRAVLGDLTRVVAGLDAQREDIRTALSSLDRLTATLAAQRRSIAGALDTLGPGLKLLADQRAQLTGLLRALSRLGEVAGRTVTRSRDATLADLRALAPILDELRRAGTALPKALELVAAYPFPRTTRSAVSGNLASLYAAAIPEPQAAETPAEPPAGTPPKPVGPAPVAPVATVTELLLGGVLE